MAGVGAEESLGTGTLVGKGLPFPFITLVALVFCVMDTTEVLWPLEFLNGT